MLTRFYKSIHLFRQKKITSRKIASIVMKTSKSIQFSRFNTSPTAPPPPPPQIKKLAVAPSDVQSNKSAHFEQIVEKTPAPCLEYLSGTDFFIIFEMVVPFSCLQCLTISGWIHFHNFEVCIILLYWPGSPSHSYHINGPYFYPVFYQICYRGNLHILGSLHSRWGLQWIFSVIGLLIKKSPATFM